MHHRFKSFGNSRLSKRLILPISEVSKGKVCYQLDYPVFFIDGSSMPFIVVYGLTMSLLEVYASIIFKLCNLLSEVYLKMHSSV